MSNPSIKVSELSSFSLTPSNFDSTFIVGLDTTNTVQSSAGSVGKFPADSFVSGVSSTAIENLYTTVNTNSSTWAGSTTSKQTIGVSSTSVVNFDASLYNEFTIILSGAGVSANFATPINGVDRQTLLMDIRFLSNTSRVNLSSNFRIPTTTLNWSNSANRFDYFAVKYNGLDNKWDVISFLPGYLF